MTADKQPGPPTICSFWHGQLSWLEQLCIASFVRNGHRFHLYAYEPMHSLPDGAEWRDAAAIVPREEIVFYKGVGTVAVFSDYFRTVLLRAGAGIWVDCDVYCVRPFAGLGPYVLGYERAPTATSSGSINSAVLLCPVDAPLLDDLASIFLVKDRPLLEPHLPLWRRIEVAARRLGGDEVAPEYMQYGRPARSR